MKLCCNRSTICIIFGSIYIVGSIIVSILSIITIFDTKFAYAEQKRDYVIQSNLKEIKNFASQT